LKFVRSFISSKLSTFSCSVKRADFSGWFLGRRELERKRYVLLWKKIIVFQILEGKVSATGRDDVSGALCKLKAVMSLYLDTILWLFSDKHIFSSISTCIAIHILLIKHG